MSYGMQVGPVRRTRSAVGEINAGLSGEIRKAAASDDAPVSVKVEATLVADGTYTLEVEASGQHATLKRVEAEDLSPTLTRLIRRLSKAVVDGELVKHRQSDSSPLGIAGGSNRDNLRFA